MTVGAKDIGLEKLVRSCFGNPNGYKCLRAIGSANQFIESGSLYRKVKQSLEEIHGSLSEDAVVIVPTYPDMVRSTYSEVWLCDYDMDQAWIDVDPAWTGCPTPPYDAALYVRYLRDRVQDEQQRAVKDFNTNNGGIVYFFGDTEAVFQGHEPRPSYLDEPDDGADWMWDVDDYSLEIPEVRIMMGVSKAQTLFWMLVFLSHTISDLLHHG
jgi:hypothetical protein